jgi:hypothetical protein
MMNARLVRFRTRQPTRPEEVTQFGFRTISANGVGFQGEDPRPDDQECEQQTRDEIGEWLAGQSLK